MGRVATVWMRQASARGLGDRTWVSEPGTSVVLRDSVHASYRTAAEFTKVDAGRVLPPARAAGPATGATPTWQS